MQTFWQDCLLPALVSTYLVKRRSASDCVVEEMYSCITLVHPPLSTPSETWQNLKQCTNEWRQGNLKSVSKTNLIDTKNILISAIARISATDLNVAFMAACEPKF